MDTVENPSQTIFHLHPQRTFGPPATSATSTASSSPILYDGPRAADTSAAGSILNIWSLIHSPSRITIARSLRGKEAQRLIDLIDQVSPVSATHLGADEAYLGCKVIALPELDQRLRKQCLHLLYKLCKACEMLPASYTIRQELIRVGNIHYCGGFADVSEGEYLERRVAIKHLRFATKDAFNNIFKVIRQWLSSPPSLTLYVAVLPGNYWLEAPVPSQRIAVAGGFRLRGSPEFPHRL